MRAVSLLFHDVYVRNPGDTGFVSPAADRYKMSVRAFEAQLDGIVRAHGTALPFLLTFDDGGVSYHTQIADRLETRGWRGHCFVSTAFIGTAGFLTAAQIRELDARGHVIGSHSVSHPKRFSACPPDQMRREWIDSCHALEDILGHAVTTASVPGGYFSPEVARSAGDAGIQVLFTSEPRTLPWRGGGCTLMGRFALKHGASDDASARLVLPSPWTRTKVWAGWTAKSIVKPVLGPAYWHAADWLLARRTPGAGKVPWPS